MTTPLKVTELQDILDGEDFAGLVVSIRFVLSMDGRQQRRLDVDESSSQDPKHRRLEVAGDEGIGAHLVFSNKT